MFCDCAQAHTQIATSDCFPTKASLCLVKLAGLAGVGKVTAAASPKGCAPEFPWMPPVGGDDGTFSGPDCSGSQVVGSWGRRLRRGSG